MFLRGLLLFKSKILHDFVAPYWNNIAKGREAIVRTTISQQHIYVGTSAHKLVWAIENEYMSSDIRDAYFIVIN